MRPSESIQGRRYKPRHPHPAGGAGRLLHSYGAGAVRALECEPLPQIRFAGDEVDAAFTAIAAFIDLKSPWLREHSMGVAELAEAAAWRSGLPAAEVALVRRAALAHDLGRVGVSNTIWEKPGRLSFGEWERVRLHSHFTEHSSSSGSRPAQRGRPGAAARAAPHEEPVLGRLLGARWCQHFESAKVGSSRVAGVYRLCADVVGTRIEMSLHPIADGLLATVWDDRVDESIAPSVLEVAVDEPEREQVAAIVLQPEMQLESMAGRSSGSYCVRLEDDVLLDAKPRFGADDLARAGRVLGCDMQRERAVGLFRSKSKHLRAKRRQYHWQLAGHRRPLINRALHRIEVCPHGRQRSGVGLLEHAFDYLGVRNPETEDESSTGLLGERSLRTSNGEWASQVDVRDP